MQFVKYCSKQSSSPIYQGYSESLEEDLKEQWTIRTLRVLHWQTPDFISNRGIPRILAAPARVSIDRKGNFDAHFYDGSPSLRGPALKAGRPANGEATEADGSVEAVVLLPIHGQQEWRVLLCVFIDKDLIATFDPKTGCFNDTADAKACDKMASYLAIESFAEMVEGEKWLPEDSNAAAILASYSGEAATRQMLDLWCPFALVPDIGEDERPTLIKMLERGGLMTALSLDKSSLKKIAHMSLWPLGSSTSLSNGSGTSTDQTWIDNLNKKSKEILGFRLLATKDGKLEPSRI